MKDLNLVALTGTIRGELVEKQTTDRTPACSFRLVIQKPLSDQPALRTSVTVSAYGDAMVRSCRQRCRDGASVLVQGELMNAPTVPGPVVRAFTLTFPGWPGKESHD